jgi:hypothetical protein
MSDISVTATGATIQGFDQHGSHGVHEQVRQGFTAAALAAAHTNELVQTDTAALMVDSDKNAAALQVQASEIAGAAQVLVNKVGSDIQVQAQQFANLASVQATTNANLASVQATSNFNALTLQSQTYASAAVLLATQNAAAAAAQLASCCCEMKSELAASTQRILDDGQKTRDLINANTVQDLRDKVARRDTEIAALYAAGKAPSSPV